MMIKTISKKDIISAISAKFYGEIQRRLINDAIRVICETMEDCFIDDSSVSIENFGSFIPSIFHAHKGMNVQTGQVRMVPAFKTVKFRPSAAFLSFISAKRKLFQKPIQAESRIKRARAKKS